MASTPALRNIPSLRCQDCQLGLGAAAIVSGYPGRIDCSFAWMNGGARRDRTDDLKLAKLALSQLSYGPEGTAHRNSGDPGFQTPGPSQRMMWWAWEDLNFRPHAYQARALTN